MSKTITTEVRLPKQTIDEVKAIAKLAGLSPESVIKLALATEVRRWQKVAAGTTAHEWHNGEVRGASRPAGEASSAEGATSTVVLGAERPRKE